MNIPVRPKRNTTQNGVPNGVHPILLKHFKELGGGGLKYHWQERGLSLFPTLAWDLSSEVQPLDQAGLKRGRRTRGSWWQGLCPSLGWALDS